MGADVKYLGDGSAVLVLGDGPERRTSLDGGRTEHKVGTVAFVRLPEIEYGEADGVHDERPEYDEEKATWTPRGLEPEEPAGIGEGGDSSRNTAPQETSTYTDNGDGTYIRDSDGQQGTFGPEGFRPQGEKSDASWGTGIGTSEPRGVQPTTTTAPGPAAPGPGNTPGPAAPGPGAGQRR